MGNIGNPKSFPIIPIVFVLILFVCPAISATRKSSVRAKKPCRRLVFYFHDIIYNGTNEKNATSVIVGAPARGDKIKLDGQNHFGDLAIFDDPITLDNNLRSTPVGRAQGFYLYDKKDVFTSWLGFSFVFNSSDHQGSINFAGADPLMNKTRDISVIGGTGDFFMARGVATLRRTRSRARFTFGCVSILNCMNVGEGSTNDQS